MLQDRREGGRVLARKLKAFASRTDVVVLGLPRGGVPVAYEVASALHAPLEVFLVRKLGMPGAEELAFGALASGGLRLVDESLLRRYGVSAEEVERITERERRELDRRELAYRGGRPALSLRGRVALLVDDGLATGSSMTAAILALRGAAPARIVAAVPVAPAETCECLRQTADAVVCALTPEPFEAVGRWYRDFDQTTDEEVRELLARARAERSEESRAASTPAVEAG
ncbi:MAG TPA: phosphoribosyltransferase family protein [Thermoanaerobaculia bacterium]|jgi:predicted phosphoribosyltransferase